MPHGLPDFGASASKLELYGGVDMAELAARLGALPRYDRLGDVVFSDDFAAGINRFEAETSGAGAAVEWTSEHHVTRGFSCKLTAGSNVNRYAGIKTIVPVPFSVVYGVEIAWTSHEDMDYGIIQADIYTGVYKISFALKTDSSLFYNYYLNSAGGWTQITPQVKPYFSDLNFINSKFTFNVSTQTYSRTLVTPVTFDIKGNSGLIVPDAGRPRMELWGRIYADAGKNPCSYVDSLILTANDV